MDDHEPNLRIGELSRRVGVSPSVLRAWESRYGLVAPFRSDAGYRLYSDADERRIRKMSKYLAEGLSPAQAAATVLRGQRTDHSSSTPARSAPIAATLRRCLDDLDEAGAQAALDRLFADYTIESVIDDALMPYLRELGERWDDGRVSVAQEHFASNLIRGRLAGLARGWGAGRGQIVLLACPPGERHDLALLAFGVALQRLGWRIHYLGADTPLAEIARQARQLPAWIVVLAATSPARFETVIPELRELSESVQLVLAGAGATSAIGTDAGATVSALSPAAAALTLTQQSESTRVTSTVQTDGT